MNEINRTLVEELERCEACGQFVSAEFLSVVTEMHRGRVVELLICTECH